MRILSLCQFSSYWGEHLPTDVLDLESGPTCGGGEEASLRTALGLKELGHEVVFYWYGRSGRWRDLDVRGFDRPLYPVLVGEHWDAVIAWSQIHDLQLCGPRTRRLLAQQLNDLWILGDWSAVDCVISPSKNHAERIRYWGWKGPQAIVHNGIDPDLYTRPPRRAWDARPKWVGYWSSPDRGLHHLLRAWPLVISQEPDAQLHVFYEIDRYLALGSGVPGMFGARTAEMGRIVPWAKAQPSIVFHGGQPRRRLAEIQCACRVHAYPCDPLQYTEGFAISVAQGLAAGCTVLATPVNALPSLYGQRRPGGVGDGGLYWLDGDAAAASFVDRLAEKIVAALRNELPNQNESRAWGQKIGLGYSWAKASDEMERACRGEWTA